MASELPYFRFTVQDWQNGKIAIESYEMQGLFISICGYYWVQDCSITLAMLRKKFSNARQELIDELIKLGIIKHENRHDKVQIDFLNLQYDLLSEKRKLRQAAGSRGGNAKAMLKQKDSYKDKDNNKDKDKFDYKSELFKLVDDKNLINEYLLIRKNKRLTNTKTAFTDFVTHCENNNITLIEAVRWCVKKSWGGFNIKWLENEPDSIYYKGNNYTQQPSQQAKTVKIVV